MGARQRCDCVYDRKTDQLATWTANKTSLSPEQVKGILYKTPTPILKGLYYGLGIVPPGDETAVRRMSQAGGVMGEKIQHGSVKEAVKFVTNPVNLAFMLSSYSTVQRN